MHGKMKIRKKNEGKNCVCNESNKTFFECIPETIFFIESHLCK